MISNDTREKIQQVASVCIRCRRCMQECIMLNRFAQNPKALFTQYLEQGPENMDRHIAYSCNECSQCTLRCPKGLNLKAVFQALKADYAAENQGIVPVEALLPSEISQDRECSPEFCTSLSGGSGRNPRGKAKYLFVPGKFPPQQIANHLRSCLGASNVEVLENTVLDAVTPRILSDLAQHPGQILITACPSGYRSLKEALPNRRVLFYWDLMQDLIGIPQEEIPAGADLRLHDSAHMPDSVRWVLDKLNCSWTETQPDTEPMSADQNCRQILGLLFDPKDVSSADSAET